MALHDRCEICDYNPAFGSLSANTAPGRHGKVRKHGDSFLCDVCAGEVAMASAVFVEEVKKE
jgi:hypothetical protein